MVGEVRENPHLPSHEQKGSESTLKTILNITANLIYAFIIVALLAIGLVFILSKSGGPGGYQLYVVQSGSMSPALKIGSIVLVEPTNRVKKSHSAIAAPIFSKGDVVTYTAGGDTVTHRVMNIERADTNFVYETKGDANRTTDVKKVSEAQVMGKASLSVPYAGYVISFAKTQTGYILLVLLPAAVIISSEMVAIGQELKKIAAERRRRVAV
jgi:signal peptidase